MCWNQTASFESVQKLFDSVERPYDGFAMTTVEALFMPEMEVSDVDETLKYTFAKTLVYGKQRCWADCEFYCCNFVSSKK